MTGRCGIGCSVARKRLEGLDASSAACFGLGITYGAGRFQCLTAVAWHRYPSWWEDLRPQTPDDSSSLPATLTLVCLAIH